MTRTINFILATTLLTAAPAMADSNAAPGPLDAFAPHELGPRARALWNTVRDRRDGLTETDALGRHDVPPAVLLSTFAHLVDVTTGPEGLYRGTVAGRWLECEQSPHTATCVALREVVTSQTDADQLAEALRDVAPENAAAVLWAHLDRMEAYVTKYVPTSRDPAAIQATPVFQTAILPVIQGR